MSQINADGPFEIYIFFGTVLVNNTKPGRMILGTRFQTAVWEALVKHTCWNVEFQTNKGFKHRGLKGKFIISFNHICDQSEVIFI